MHSQYRKVCELIKKAEGASMLQKPAIAMEATKQAVLLVGNIIKRLDQIEEVLKNGDSK